MEGTIQVITPQVPLVLGTQPIAGMIDICHSQLPANMA